MSRFKGFPRALLRAVNKLVKYGWVKGLGFLIIPGFEVVFLCCVLRGLSELNKDRKGHPLA